MYLYEAETLPFFSCVPKWQVKETLHLPKFNKACQLFAHTKSILLQITVIITSLVKMVIFLVVLVYLFVCLDNITQKVMNGLG